MKRLMILGAMIGFSLGLVLGLAQHTPWPATFWRACVGAFLLGFLFRWWSSVVCRTCRQAKSAPQTPSKTAPLTTRPGAGPPGV